MLHANNTILAGKMKLQNDARPPLIAGSYTVTANLELSDPAKLIKSDNTFHQEIQFEVGAPRYALPEALIGPQYPAMGDTGDYTATLPHILLKRKTIPWERTLADGNGWITLLLLTRDELQAHGLLQDMDVTAIQAGSDKILAPKIEAGAEERKLGKIKVLELSLDFFWSIAPLAEDLRYMTHTRQVDVSDKENADENPSGWYAAVVANRLPRPGKEHVAFLVSLEGHDDLVNRKAPAQGSAGKSLRLVVLKQWHFTAYGATFQQLVEKLVENTAPLRVEQPALKSGDTPPTEGVKTALRLGYVPVQHLRRLGGKTVSWYRGPLVPVFAPKLRETIYDNADKALRFDRNTGFFDISYSVAWQLGRLLALQQPGFSAAISNWKNSFRRQKPISIAGKILSDTFGSNPEDDDGKVPMPRSRKDDGTVPLKAPSPQPLSFGALLHEVETDEVLASYMLELWSENQPSPSTGNDGI